MRLICLTGLLLSAVLPLGTAGEAPLRADANPAAEQEIKNLEFQMIAQIQKKDMKAYGANLAADYVAVNDAGEMRSKEQMLALFRGSEPADATARMDPEDLRVRIYGDTAVMNFVLNQTSSVGGRQVRHRSRLTKVFVRRQGRWFMVNNQGTPLPAAPAPQ